MLFVGRLADEVLDALTGLAEAGLDLDDADALELLGRAPDPERGARLARSTIATSSCRRASSQGVTTCLDPFGRAASR